MQSDRLEFLDMNLHDPVLAVGKESKRAHPMMMTVIIDLIVVPRSNRAYDI